MYTSTCVAWGRLEYWPFRNCHSWSFITVHCQFQSKGLELYFQVTIWPRKHIRKTHSQAFTISKKINRIGRSLKLCGTVHWVLLVSAYGYWMCWLIVTHIISWESVIWSYQITISSVKSRYIIMSPPSVHFVEKFIIFRSRSHNVKAVQKMIKAFCSVEQHWDHALLWQI